MVDCPDRLGGSCKGHDLVSRLQLKARGVDRSDVIAKYGFAK
jgi:hypothetical protein